MTARIRGMGQAACLGLIMVGTVLNAKPAESQVVPPELLALVDERAAYRGASAGWMRSIIQCESRWDIYAVGLAGELGLVQLHPRGLLREFLALGYADPFDPSEAIDYLAWALVHGRASHWSCA